MTADILKPAEVTVLMSTYNGEQFLQQQLNSLYEQTYPHVKILVRDDGSSDATRDILAQARIEQLTEHHNLGITRSFFTLLQHAAQTETAYVAFCDQDDIWQTDKIERAVSVLAEFSDRPALYCSQVEIVTEQLETLKLSAKPRKIGFGNALIENIAIGCTTVLNRKAIDLLCQQPLPSEVFIHDWWCYLVISCFGKVIFDERPLIKYRQHGGNFIGATTNRLGILKRKLTRLLSGRPWSSKQAVIFSQLYADQLPPEQRELVELVIKAKSSFWYRTRLALSTSIWRQQCSDNLILRVIILMNKI